MNARARAQIHLEQAIEELVREFEDLHSCEVSSLWIEHAVAPPFVQVRATTAERVTLT